MNKCKLTPMSFRHCVRCQCGYIGYATKKLCPACGNEELTTVVARPYGIQHDFDWLVYGFQERGKELEMFEEPIWGHCLY